MIQVPAVQSFARTKIVAYLQNKIHTTVRINKLSLDFPKSLVLEGVYFEDQHKDTLFSGGKIEVDIALLQLIRSKVEINYVELKDIRAKIYRTGTDTAFNYDYIVKAFTSGPKDTTKADTSGGMKINVDKIYLENIAASFKDDQSGIDFLMRLGKFKTAFKKFDLNKMVFSLPDITLANVSGYMYQNKPLMQPKPMSVVVAQSQQPVNVQLELKNISFKNIQYVYRNDVSPMRATLNLGEFSGKVKSIDLAKLDVQIDEVKLLNTTAAIGLGKSEQTKMVKKEISKEVVAQVSNPWKVSITSLDFENNNLAFENDNSPRLAKGMDYGHLKISGFKLKGNSFQFTPTRYAGIITDGGFTEQSGFNLKQFKTDFAYSDTGAYLNNLYVQTDHTLIRDRIDVKYPSLDAVTKDMGKLYLDANLSKTDIGARDILLFAPQLQGNLNGNESAVIHINGNVKGYVNDLSIPELQVYGIGSTRLSMSGTLKGLPDPNKTVYHLTVNNFQTTRADLVKLLPPKTLPSSMRLPEIIKMSGTFNGLVSNFSTKLLLQTNKGTATINGYMNQASKTYDFKGSLNNVDVGYLAKQDTLVGKVTLDFTAKGNGFKPSTLNTNAKINVKSAFIKGYNYQNLLLTATVKKGSAIMDAGMGDKSVAFALHGEAMLDDKYATNIKMRLLLDSVLLHPLGLTSNDLRLHGNVVADLPSIDMKAPVGTVQVTDLVVFNNGKRYKADTISVTASSSDTGKVITLNSQVARAVLTGNYQLTTISTGVMQLVNKYYNIGIKTNTKVNDKWALNATLIPDSLLFSLMPSLAGTDTIHLHADFDGNLQKMNLLVNAPIIQMGTQKLDSLTISASNDDTQLNYAATVHTAGSKSFMVDKTSLIGFISNNELFSRLNIKDKKGKDKYGLGVKVAPENMGIKTSLSDTLMLNYNNWAVDNSNYIRYDSTGIIIHHFSINNQGESLGINSKTENTSAPVDVTIKDFYIKTLTNLAEQDSLAVDGVINGTATVSNIMTAPVFISDITVDNLMYNTDTVGNIIVKVDNQTTNAYNANVAITGHGNDVQLSGKYYTGEGRMDLKMDVNNLNMASVRPLTFGALTQADGSLKGNIVMKGTTTKPEVVGSMRFENASLTPAASGEKLHLSNEEITVTASDISFNTFTMTDSAGNKAVLDGKIHTEDFKTYRFDNMDLVATNFRVLNARKVQNTLYYGKLNMDADINVEGTLTAPSISADLKINKATDITFVLPSSNPEIQSRDGVVEFVDVYGKHDSIFTGATDTLAQFAKLAGMDITGTLLSDSAAQITLVIDERSGDALKIKGKANLSGGIDQSGKISLTGDYALGSGSYQLSMSILKRQFLIQSGSLITWQGDPMSATVDITAVYVANTQPINLLVNDLGNLSQNDENIYKEKIPFNVLLKMKGELLKPQISFDIQLPDELKNRWANVETKLVQVRHDDAELNKQVFALLLLNRFVQDNPLQNSAEGTSIAGSVKSSVSSLLAEQLNNLASSLIKGVNLNFGVNSNDDYSSGTRTNRTNLTVGVSKSLLNDRLRVSVGSNFELEGTANANENASNIAGDVAVDYLLSKDGRYTLRAYRRNNYEGVIEGQVIESGVSFIFTFDFNEFKEILNKKTEEQKRKIKIDKERMKSIEDKKKNAK